MNTEIILLAVCIALLALCAVLLVVLLSSRRRMADEMSARTGEALDVSVNAASRELADTLGTALRDALDRSADAAEARQNRLEGRLAQDDEILRKGVDDSRREMLGLLQSNSERSLAQIQTLSDKQTAQLIGMADSLVKNLSEMSQRQSEALRNMRDTLSQGLSAVSETTGDKLSSVNQTVNDKLLALQKSNEERLEKMRETVEEKLQSTLQTRLTESFRLVSSQLQEIERGLGEMRGLASNVDALKRVMTNVKTRGTFGETQLGAILSQILTPEQYAENVETVPGSGKRVEFAVRMPGPERGTAVWLPIDAKFPQEDWERLEDAREKCDKDAELQAQKAFRTKIDAFAKDISTKYLSAPHTTDFGIMYLPTENLYAEVLRIPGLFDDMQKKWHVMPAGPTVVAALLNSLRMGFRTLAIQERSAEVWKLLGAVKGEFLRFSEALKQVDLRIRQAQDAVDTIQKRTSKVDRKLSQIEALPSAPVLPALDDAAPEDASSQQGK